MAPRLRAVGAPTVVVEGCERAASEEERHAELCLAIARRHAGTDPGELVSPPFVMPNFRTGDERLELLFLITGTCAINETLAVAYIRACIDVARDPLAVAENRAHLRDEIGHGRIGWALCASTWVDDELRAALSARLVRLLDANVPLWLRIDPELGADGAPHFGHPDNATMRRVILSAVRDVIVPGFAHVGLDVAPLAKWQPPQTARGPSG